MVRRYIDLPHVPRRGGGHVALQWRYWPEDLDKLSSGFLTACVMSGVWPEKTATSANRALEVFQVFDDCATDETDPWRALSKRSRA